MDGTLVEEIEPGGIVHRYRVLDGLFEEKGREPTPQEQASTDNVMLRSPPLTWGLRADYEPRRRTGDLDPF